ncbi:hypothetical protein LXA43DRAFT_1065411 [Ganoderma leucocontextum]|nr:hypothetical protein LXA43DRAFT_1065411 [Ganoderma leucocontextum]
MQLSQQREDLVPAGPSDSHTPSIPQTLQSGSSPTEGTTTSTAPAKFAWHLRHQLTVRDACQKAISSKHPDFTPRDDFELYTLGTSNYQGAQSDLEAWLKSMHYVTLHRDFRGDLGRLNSTYASMLERSLDGALGLKPAPEDKDGVIFRSVPESKYALRLWPASPSHQMHCLDFVDTETALPVNLPSGFELWTVLANSPDTVEYQRLHSLENIYGYYDEAIVAGEEKFVVRDGMQGSFRSRRPLIDIPHAGIERPPIGIPHSECRRCRLAFFRFRFFTLELWARSLKTRCWRVRERQ